MKYLIVIEKTDTGHSAYAPDVPGCIGGKAQFFESLGFSADRAAMLIDALCAVAQTGEVVESGSGSSTGGWKRLVW